MFFKFIFLEHSVLMCSPWLYTIDFLLWIGCAELNSRNWWQSVDLQERSGSNSWLLILTITSKKINRDFTFLMSEFYIRMESIQTLQETFKFIFTFNPDKKNIYLPYPYLWFCILWLKKCTYQLIHQNTCMKAGKSSFYGCTRSLLFNTWIKLKVVVFQYIFNDIN